MVEHKIKVELVSATTTVFDNECWRVSFTAGSGVITLQANQAEFISSLQAGSLMVRINSKLSKKFQVSEGLVHYKNNKLLVAAKEIAEIPS